MGKSNKGVCLKTLGLTFGIIEAAIFLFMYYYPVLTLSLTGTAKGQMALDLITDIYPYYPEVWYGMPLLVITGLVDGFIFGVIVGWLYNKLSK